MALAAVLVNHAASPARVLAAWSNSATQVRWFSCHDDWTPSHYELDFRVGGRARLRTGPAGGTVHAFSSVFQDIVPNQRIVFS